MATVKENLIAAKALIDTQEKLARTRVLHAVRHATSDDAAKTIRALQAALPPGFSTVPSFAAGELTMHFEVMALFDRAIAAQEA